MARTVKKPAERRKEIIDAARSLFQSKDYDQTTMQDVIEAVGIAKGTVYYYFKSKEELLEAVVNDIAEASAAYMQAIVDEPGGNALDKLRRLIAAGNVGHEHDAILEHLHRPGNISMHTRLLATALMAQSPLYAQVIEQGRREGIFQTDTPLEAAEFILTAVQFLTDEGFYPWTQETLMRRAMALPGLIEALLKAQPGSFQFLLEP